MSDWAIYVYSFLCWQVVSTQYFYWTACYLQYGGECRGLCRDGEVNLGLPYCSSDNDVSFGGTCCVALPCWYLGGICRTDCLPENETRYDLPTTCPEIRSTCCMQARPPGNLAPHTTTVTTPSTTTTLDTTSTRLPQWLGDCGKPRTPDTGGISGSNSPGSGPCQHPWVVSLRTTFSQHYCSGVLVSDNTVLTVATCVDGLNALQLILTLGDYDVDIDEATEVIVDVVSIIPHPLHRSTGRGFNLALLRFRNRVETGCVRRICLPGTETTPANLQYGRCVLAGWGDPEDYRLEHKLRVRPVRVYDTLACDRLLLAMWANTTLPPDVICSLQDDVDDAINCQIDGGSVLMCPDLYERYFLFGVVTEFTCINPAMALYTDISFHTDWIRRHAFRQF